MGALEGCLKKMNREGSERANERTRRKPFTKTKSLAGINGRYLKRRISQGVCVCCPLFCPAESVRFPFQRNGNATI